MFVSILQFLLNLIESASFILMSIKSDTLDKDSNACLMTVQFKMQKPFTEDRFGTQEVSQRSKQNRMIQQRLKNMVKTH